MRAVSENLVQSVNQIACQVAMDGLVPLVQYSCAISILLVRLSCPSHGFGVRLACIYSPFTSDKPFAFNNLQPFII